MTDRECLEQILKSLGLIRIDPVVRHNINANEYYITEDNSIVLGWGRGDYDCDVVFTFDENGRIIYHAVRS